MYRFALKISEHFGKLSVGETGALRLKDGKLLFFDYQTEKDYVICSRSNCSHNDSSCNGSYNGHNGAVGLAEYGGKLYCFVEASEKNVYELVQMDLDGDHRKVIVEIDRGNSEPGNWEADLSLIGTYYAGDKAITILDWMYHPLDDSEENISTQQCIAVDLKSGKIIEVTPRQEEPVQCLIDGISDKGSVIKVSGNQDQYLLFDLKEGDIQKIKGDVDSPFYILGEYEGDLIIEEFEKGLIEDEEVIGTIKTRVYRWDLKQDKKELLLELDNGYVFDAGNIDAGSIADGDKLLFMKRKPEGRADYYSYSLKSGNEELLYEEVRNVPYRIIGETEDSFIYHTYTDKKWTMYMMNKEDYYKGNFEDSVRLKKLDRWLGV